MAKKYDPPHYDAGIVIDKLIFSAVSTANKGSQLLDKIHRKLRETKTNKAELKKYVFERDNDNNNRYKHTFRVSKKDMHLGILTVKHLKKKNYDDYVFTVDNALHYLSASAIPTISILLDDLELNFSKIIQLDIAIDHYKSNPQKAFWKAMQNPKNKVKIKRDLYPIGKYIPHIEVIASGKREDRHLIETTYIKQHDGAAKKALVLYDKLCEIHTVSDKEYIPLYHFLREENIEDLQRAEIRTSGKYITHYQTHSKQTIDLEFLYSPAHLFDYFTFHLNRLVMITDAKGRVNTFVAKPYIELKEIVGGGRKKEVVAVQF